MTRGALILLLLALAPPGEAAAAAKRSAAAVLTACEPSLDQAARSVVVEGRMRRRPGTRRMLIRFELEVRDADSPAWRRVKAPGFGVWARSRDPAPRRYVYAKRVEGLTAPAAYRMVVRFKWLGAGRRALATARRRSRACRQPDLRPDLTPLRVTIASAETASGRRYVVPLTNDGGTRAEPSSVTLTVNGATLAPQRVPAIEAGGRAEVEFDGPPCEPGSSIAVRVDSDGTVDERDEADNDLIRACPDP